jgi:hypothetical protein
MRHWIICGAAPARTPPTPTRTRSLIPTQVIRAVERNIDPRSPPLLRRLCLDQFETCPGGKKLGRYIARLAAEATTIINAPEYAKTVRDLANRRRMIDVARDCISGLNTAPPEITPEAIVADTIARLDEITTGQIPHTLRAVGIGDAGRDALEQLSTVMQGNSAAVGIPYGISDLDRRTDGIHRGEVSVLAARPRHGQERARRACRACRVGGRLSGALLLLGNDRGGVSAAGIDRHRLQDQRQAHRLQ